MRNIEIKARPTDFHKQRKLAERLGDGDTQHLFQEDTYFCVTSGRLKIREFGNGSGELIQYERKNVVEPTECRYLLCPVDNSAILKEVLTKALGVRAVVRKKRIVFLVGQTRVHLDDVENLGQFIELEVVLRTGETFEYGAGVAENLMKQLGIGPQDLIKASYVDLLEGESGQ